MPKPPAPPILSALFLFFFAASCAEPEAAGPAAGTPTTPPVEQPPSAPPPAPVLPTNGIVACFYEEARAAGVAVLEEGGTATDAFVAITLVEYVRASGETSLGGPLGAMTYEAKTGKVESLDATFDSPRDPAGRYDAAAPKNGASVLVPGALRGLETLWKAKGKLPWKRLVEPARKLAEIGYAADSILVGSITSRREVLERSEYAKALYLPGGSPLAVGAIVKQPEVAAFLGEVADQGARAMYDDGTWAKSFVDQVNAQGGKTTLADLAGYEARWQEPHVVTLRGKEIYANSGRAYGGVYDLVGLSVLDHDPRAASELGDTDRLEVQLRTARALYDDPWFYEGPKLDDRTFVKSRIGDTNALWATVAAGFPVKPKSAKGTHSLHVTVIDRTGDAITGTNTMNSMPWGSGIFVRGVALTDAGTTTFLVPGPGQRVVSPLTLHVVKSGDHLHFIGGTFGSSLLETELQVVADAVFGKAKTASEIVARTRFGTFTYDDGGVNGDVGSNWIDKRAADPIVKELGARGLVVKRDPYGDTGWGTFLLRGPDGALAPGVLDATWFRASVTVLAK